MNEQTRTITDKLGQQHLLEENWQSDVHFTLVLRYHRQRSGYLHGMKFGATIRIVDFQVEDEIHNPKWLARLLNPTISMRGRGLGSGLLKHLEMRAKELGVKIMKGDVTPKDRTATPHLLSFYSNHGFHPEPENQDETSMTHIVKHL